MGYQEITMDELVGSYPTCNSCGSRSVVRDAWAVWDGLAREWVLKTVFDEFVCEECGGSTKPVWKIDEAFRKKRIRRLNDELRRGQAANGAVVVTAGVKEVGNDFLAKVSGMVASFDEFSEDNDPHEEHDFGAVDVESKKLFWKIDYFDLNLKMRSPDAANPALTNRVLTIMLASEY